MKRILIILVVIAGAALGIVAGRMRSTGSHEDSIDPYPGVRLSAGRVLPAHTFHDLEGKAVELHELIGGQKTVLFFFSTECQPCLDYVNEWDEWLTNADFDYRFIGVSPDDKAKLYAFETTYEPTFRTLWDRDEVFGLEYGITSLPVVVGVEESGVISFVEIGYRKDKHVEIDSWLRDG